LFTAMLPFSFLIRLVSGILNGDYLSIGLAKTHKNEQ
jgi:hypothetical protein